MSEPRTYSPSFGCTLSVFSKEGLALLLKTTVGSQKPISFKVQILYKIYFIILLYWVRMVRIIGNIQ